MVFRHALAFQRMHRDLPLGDLCRTALPSQLIQALPVLLQSAVHGRALPKLTRKGRNHRPQRRLVRVIGSRGKHLPLRVLCICRRAERSLRHVDLFLLLHIIEQPGRFSDHQRQHAGGFRIQRSPMAYLGPVQQPAHVAYHLRGSHSRRLEDIQKAAEGLFCFTHESFCSSNA